MSVGPLRLTKGRQVTESAHIICRTITKGQNKEGCHEAIQSKVCGFALLSVFAN